jgi:hypothetical protein
MVVSTFELATEDLSFFLCAASVVVGLWILDLNENVIFLWDSAAAGLILCA